MIGIYLCTGLESHDNNVTLNVQIFWQIKLSLPAF